MIHDIDVTYFLCDVDDCEYKAKQASDLKQHKANVHDIDVTFYVVLIIANTRLREPVISIGIKLWFMISM